MALDPPKLLGGALALDFCNTESGRGGPRHHDRLRDDADVVAWASAIGIRAAPAPAGLLERARALRGAIHASLTAGEPAALALLAREHAACLAEARLVPAGDAYRWEWDGTSAAALLGPIALSAVALLTRPSARLRQCPGADCGWLFLDTTRNGSRRWCEMAICGNRAKQRRRRSS